ncbi:MAG: phosphatase PAP2 family protein [Tissierellia bacterium]|nr:phosphatase PAP2 family protein [Tissierellia bacterium]
MKNKKWVLFNTILLIVFLYLGFLVRNSSEGILFDIRVLDFIHNSSNPILLAIMRLISFIGSETFLFPAMGIVIIYTFVKKRYFIAKILLANTLGSWVFNYILKWIFQRTRPFDYALVTQGGLSYPSGHSMVTMSMYLAIAYLLSRNIHDGLKKINIYIIASAFIILMGISRMYLGVHWPTDIIGGYIMGYLFFNITVIGIKK